MKACKSLNQSKFELLSHYYKITLKSLLIHTYTYLISVMIIDEKKNSRSFAVSVPFDILWETLVLHGFLIVFFFILSINTGLQKCILVWHRSICGWMPFLKPPWSTGNQTLDLSLGIPCPTHSTTATPYDYWQEIRKSYIDNIPQKISCWDAPISCCCCS